MGVEDRGAPRGPASAVPSITGVRLSPHGGDCVLVNISATGLLADCGERVQTGSSVTVNFEGTFTPRSVQGKVIRSSVSSMAMGKLRYHVGIAFNSGIKIPELEPRAEAAAAAPASGSAAAGAPGHSRADRPETPAPGGAVNRW
jgi:hypothetical protein